MADISKIKALNGTTYNIKDEVARTETAINAWPYQRPIQTKTYTNVIATANNNQGAAFFYMKVRANTWNSTWRIKVRLLATVPGQDLWRNDTIFEIWGFQNTYSAYSCNNHITTTSYRPIYYHSHFRVSQTGYNNGCGGWIGFNLWYAQNNTNTSYKRTVIVELLEYENCTVEMQDMLITPDNIPERAAHTNYYSSSNTSFDNFDACYYGLRQSGDANTTTITYLYEYGGNYVADSAIYRYQLLFQVDENILTPLNNNNNVTGTTKTMLTDKEFRMFGRIYYWNSGTTYAAGAAIGNGSGLLYTAAANVQYTFNCGSTLVAHKPLYLKVIGTGNGMCKIANSTPWAQELPTEADGYYYILLGRMYGAAGLTLFRDHPVYYHDGTAIREAVPNAGNATTSLPGLMSAADKTKLDGIDVGANKLPDVSTTDNGKALLVSGGQWVAAAGIYISKLNASNLNSGTVPSARLPIADTTTLGAIKVGAGLNVSDSGMVSVKTELPTVTTSDNGKFLQVVNGNWMAMEYAAAEGVGF